MSGRSAEAAPTAPGSWPGTGRRRVGLDAALLLLAGAALLVCLVPEVEAARTAILLAALCLVPGGALLTRLEVEGAAEAATLAVVFSLALATALALVMAWTGWWHPTLWAAVLGVPAALALAFDLALNLGRAG